jgi:hypothetical protein
VAKKRDCRWENDHVSAAALKAVAEFGECTALQVTGRVWVDTVRAVGAGRYKRECQARIDQKRGQRVGVGRPRSTAQRIGHRDIIGKALCYLVKVGKLRRVRRGVYALPSPKLFDPKVRRERA